MSRLSNQELGFYAPHLERVAGLEREYGLQFDRAEHGVYDFFNDEITDNQYLRQIKDLPGMVWCGQMNITGRWYPDIGNHPEHSTNEYLNYGKLALAQVGADTMMAEAAQRALIRRLEQYKIVGEEVTLCIRSSDDIQKNYFGGVHVNLSMARSAFDTLFHGEQGRYYGNERTDQYASYLLMSALVVGAGAIRRNLRGLGEGYTIHPFDRMHASEELVSSNTTNHRPIVNTRDEPNASAGTHARLHTISLDAHTSPLSDMLQVAGLSAMLRTFEIDKPIPRWLADPVSSLRKLSMFPDTLLQVTDGETTSMIPSYEYALELYGSLVDLANKEGFPAQERIALQRIYDGIYDYLDGDKTDTDVTDVMPWLLKKTHLEDIGLLDKRLETEELEQLHAEHRMFDTYIIRPEEIVMGAHMQKVRHKKVVDAARTELMTPPTDTRAARRVEAMRGAVGTLHNEPSATWYVVKSYDETMHTFDQVRMTSFLHPRSANPIILRHAS